MQQRICHRSMVEGSHDPALSVYFEISRRPGNWSADIAREDRIVGRQLAYETRNVDGAACLMDCFPRACPDYDAPPYSRKAHRRGGSCRFSQRERASTRRGSPSPGLIDQESVDNHCPTPRAECRFALCEHGPDRIADKDSRCPTIRVHCNSSCLRSLRQTLPARSCPRRKGCRIRYIPCRGENERSALSAAAPLR